MLGHASIKVVGGFAKSIPDIKFEIKEVLVAEDRAIVRGEVTGTPAWDLFGARTDHLENWLSALGQLRAN